MYSDKKVSARLALAESEFHFCPTYHTVAEVADFDARLRREGKYTFNAQGIADGTRDLSAADAQWILNEQVIVQCDAAYFLTRYAWLRDEEGVVCRFNFRVPQRIYFDIICDLEERETAIEIMALKARQLGISLFSELLIAHRSVFSYGVSSVIGSADQSKTSEMSRMMILCYDMLPVWLRPQYTSRVESDRGHLLFGHMASGTSFQHGSQKFGIATGSTVTIYHLSEVAMYGDRSVELIDEGLWKAVHPSTAVFGVLESTGRSNKGWWAETWYYSKAKWPRCRMFPMFLPWYCGTDMYPKPAFLRKTPVPFGWRPNHDTRFHIAKAELFVAASALLSKHLLAEQSRRNLPPADDGRWHMPLEQQWWWEVTHDEAKAKGNESSFLQEYAGDDDEALQHSIESVFGHAAIAEIDSHRKKNYECYTLSGQSIESAHEVAPEYFDYSRERVPVRYSSKRGETYRWEVIPLKSETLREDSPEDVDRILLVWHHPRPGVSYSIGIDTSEGKGQDSTVISVWTYGLADQPDIQCAEFSSPYVNHVEVFSFALCIAAYYAKFMEFGVTKWKEPYVTIEQVAAVGDVAQGQMARMGYSNFHKMPRYDGSLRRIARMKRGPNAKPGWYTYGWSRPILIGNFVHAAQNNWAEINSPWLLEEMRHFEVHVTSTGKERLEHEEGEHDDRIFAAAMAIFCPHDVDKLADRSKKRSVEGVTLPTLDLSPYRGNVVPSAAMKGNTMDSLDDLLYSDSYGRRQ